MIKNLFYFKSLHKLGGTEQFLYEIAKKYHSRDVVVYYDTIDPQQEKRLKRYLKCVKRVPGKKVKCVNAFLNFNIDIIDDLEYEKDCYFVVHAIFSELGYCPPTHPRITKIVAVSQYACNNYYENTGIMPIRCYNPITLEKPKKVLNIVIASRLADGTKGGDRSIKFIEACDRYCKKFNRHYVCWAFTDKDIKVSPNVFMIEPTIDVRQYISSADYTVQLSNNMESYCYTIAESLSYGVPVITTPLTVCEELPIPQGARLICDWDMKNVDAVVKEMFERDEVEFKYNPPEDIWGELLEQGENTYEGEFMIKVKALSIYKEREIADKGLGRIPEPGEEFEITEDRLDTLMGDNIYHEPFVEVIEKKKVEYVISDEFIDLESKEEKPKRKKKSN